MVPVLVAKAMMSYEEVLEDVKAVRRELKGKQGSKGQQREGRDGIP